MALIRLSQSVGEVEPLLPDVGFGVGDIVAGPVGLRVGVSVMGRMVGVFSAWESVGVRLISAGSAVWVDGTITVCEAGMIGNPSVCDLLYAH